MGVLHHRDGAEHDPPITRGHTMATNLAANALDALLDHDQDTAEQHLRLLNPDELAELALAGNRLIELAGRLGDGMVSTEDEPAPEPDVQIQAETEVTYALVKRVLAGFRWSADGQWYVAGPGKAPAEFPDAQTSMNAFMALVLTPGGDTDE